MSTGPWVSEMQAEFPDLFARQGRIKHHKRHARLHEVTVIKQQRPPRTNPTARTLKKKEINRLLQEGHEVQDIKEDVFLQPTVITAKKDRSVR